MIPGEGWLLAAPPAVVGIAAPVMPLDSVRVAEVAWVSVVLEPKDTAEVELPLLGVGADGEPEDVVVDDIAEDVLGEEVLVEVEVEVDDFVVTPASASFVTVTVEVDVVGGDFAVVVESATGTGFSPETGPSTSTCAKSNQNCRPRFVIVKVCLPAESWGDS